MNTHAANQRILFEKGMNTMPLTATSLIYLYEVCKHFWHSVVGEAVHHNTSFPFSPL
jgi:hypothetical protein